MPAEHLDSQQGTTCLQQLQALAALHNAIAHGRASLQREWYLCEDEQPPGRTPFAARSAISPDATCVAAAWRDERTSSVGVDVVGHEEAGSEWRQCMPPSAHAGSYTTGWSTCGRYYAYLGYPDTSSSAAVAQICDIREQSLLPALDLGAQLPDRASFSACRFSDDAQLAAAFTSRVRGDARDGLTVFGVGTPFVAHVVSEYELCDYLWLPGQHVLVLLSRVALARVDVASLQSGGSVPVRWTQYLRARSLAAIHTRPCMALVPGSGALCVVHCAAQVSLTLYRTPDLNTLACWTQARPGQAYSTPALVSASRRAIAVTVDRPLTSVNSLDCDSLGALLFEAQLSRASFSQDGRFMVGSEWHGDASCVLDARSGHCVARLQPALPSGIVVSCIISVQWAVHDPSLLLVTGQEGRAARQGTLCSVLRFS